ncbi:dihydrodipicolinate synthase family protein [Campylobacter showae]|uniref:dihydrodipicolinate synthase family protein n=1 Tax=Campylobacter showae TaxID=204 RepID=UPI0026EB909D|nr:dihydrodipicolinate synthase family protein [Campylobacter showae]
MVPIITPIDENELIDEAKMRDQVDYVIDGGVLGILAFGSNGEFYMLEEDEMERGLNIMLDQAKGRVPVYFGIGAIRGSSSKGAVKALAQSFRELKSGVDVIITPDGPRGPYHSVADGAVVIAQKQNAQIQILNYEASKFWQLKSWDKMIIPKPFSEISYTLSPPFSVTGMELEAAREQIKKEMEK